MSKVVNIENERFKKMIGDFWKRESEQKNKDADLLEDTINNGGLEESKIFNEIYFIDTFGYNNETTIYIIKFRKYIYLINHIGNGEYEYLGSIEDILRSHLN